MLSIPVLDQLHTLLTALAIFATLTSLHLYTHSFNIRLNAVSALIPVAATIGGITLYHWAFHWWPFMLLGMGILIVSVPQRIRLLTAHSVLCGVLVYATLIIDSSRYEAKKQRVSTNYHTLHGLVIDKREWNKKGAAVTVQIWQVNHQPCTGIAKFFVYSNPWIEAGDYAIFFHTTLTTQNNKQELASYAAREHLLGIQFCPYLKTKKLGTLSLYGKWIAYWHGARNNLYNKLEAILPSQIFTYLAALFLGNKNRDGFLAMRTKFTNWGLTHYLARSGLHISLLVSLWVAALRWLPISLAIKGILLFSMLCLYDHLSWANISFNRALWLWFFYLGSWLTDRIATPIFGFAHLTLLILLTNPWYAGCLDFQLSFFLTGVLMLYSYFRKQQFMLSSCVNKNK